MPNDYVLLPKLQNVAEAPAPAGTDAQWYEYPTGRHVLLDFANTLDIPDSNVAAEKIKSTPSPWARPLLFEKALFLPHHPAHDQVLGEWRGLLARIGMGEYLGAPVQLVPLSLSGNRPLEDLRAMLPLDSGDLWTRPVLIQEKGRNGSVTLGCTSPTTIVFTSIRAIAGSTGEGDTRFERQGRLVDPTDFYLALNDAKPLEVLESWLTAFLGKLEPQAGDLRFLGQWRQGQRNDSDTRIGRILELLREWRDETRSAVRRLSPGSTAVQVDFNDSPFDVIVPENSPLRPLFGALVLAKPLKESQENELQVYGSTQVPAPLAEPSTGLVIKGAALFTGVLRLPAGQSRRVTDGVVTQRVGVDAATRRETIDFTRFFEAKLIQLVGAAPDSTFTLRAAAANGSDDYLYPFSPEILKHLSADDIRQWSSISGDSRAGYTVRLSVPISNGLSIRYERKYEPAAIVDNCNPPTLAVWPDFESSTWDKYYYASLQLLKRGARLQFDPVPMPYGTQPTLKKDAPEQGLSWGCTSQPVQAWIGADAANGKTRGLLLSSRGQHVPSLGESTRIWDISIDFGSTQTKVFRRETGEEHIGEVLLQPRVRTHVGTTEHLPFYFFPGATDGAEILNPDRGVPSMLWLPLGTSIERPEGWLPSDGHVFSGLRIDDTRQGRIIDNLKWRQDDSGQNAAFHNFVAQLFVSIAAEAAISGAKVSTLTTAYPSVLPGWLKTQHQNEWNKVAERFKIEFLAPLSESDAVVAYLKKKHGVNEFSNLLAVDIGGSTSDFAVWESGRPALDSIQLAGNILNRLLAIDPDTQQAASSAAQGILNEQFRWKDDPESNQVNAGLLLRRVANTHVGAFRDFGMNLYARGPGSPGERILAHVGFLFSVVAYTLGQITMRSSVNIGDNYRIYLAGRGGHLLSWLDAFGPSASRNFVSTFFCAGLGVDGSGASKINVNVNLPGTEVKEEVGRGLLLDKDASAISSVSSFDRETFVGEAGFTTGQRELGWKDPLSVDVLRNLDRPDRPSELSQRLALNAFVNVYFTDPLARQMGQALGIVPQAMNSNLRDRIHDQVYGLVQRASVANASQRIVLEPMFVSEAKALLEHCTGKMLFQA